MVNWISRGRRGTVPLSAARGRDRSAAEEEEEEGRGNRQIQNAREYEAKNAPKVTHARLALNSLCVYSSFHTSYHTLILLGG